MLSERTASTQRLAFVGLAKNTGKTEALAALLRELELEGRRVGVTSVGRDGEERDVIDPRIAKPQVRLPAGGLVATTDALLRTSGAAHVLLEDTGMRTPLGRVLIARLRDAAAIEVAGPSAAADVRAVSDAMLALGAEQVLIDGALDRRAASSPEVADGLVMSTGAILARDIDEVVAQTSDAVELVRLPSVHDGTDAGRRLGVLAAATVAGATSTLAGDEGEPIALPPGFVLAGAPEQIARALAENPAARWLIVAGALPEQFLRELLRPVSQRERELTLVVADPTKVFISAQSPEWYRRQGIQLRTLARIDLEAITVNPVAPQSHRFDSAQLRALLQDAIHGVPVFDVLHPDYMAARASAPKP
jgi:hypothetical protein